MRSGTLTAKIEPMKKLITICYSLFAALQMEAQYYSVVDTYAGESSTGLLDGPLETALFDQPYSLDYDPATGAIYVADAYNHCIRKILNGMVTTLAGNGEQGDEQDASDQQHPTGGRAATGQGREDAGAKARTRDQGGHRRAREPFGWHPRWQNARSAKNLGRNLGGP